VPLRRLQRERPLWNLADDDVDEHHDHHEHDAVR
jgi:hypothetical protein